ncbi:MAG: hypothetical protein IPO40_13620 [Fibrobacteres bacterium]|nr:hypothetical protein [Fibrobacterota bacterium]
MEFRNELEFDLDAMENEILNGRGREQYLKFRKATTGELNATEGIDRIIHNQIKKIVDINEPVAAYLMGRFRKDKRCGHDLENSVSLWVMSSTDMHLIPFLKILSRELGPEGQKWCENCILSISSKANEKGTQSITNDRIM